MYSNPSVPYSWDSVPLPFAIDLDGIVCRVAASPTEARRFKVCSCNRWLSVELLTFADMQRWTQKWVKKRFEPSNSLLTRWEIRALCRDSAEDFLTAGASVSVDCMRLLGYY